MLLKIKRAFLYIWNGGLNPELTEPGLLRKRRSVSITAILLMPVCLVLMLANTFLFGVREQNLPIIIVLIFVGFGLYLQAARGWNQIAATLIIAAFWIAPSSLILQGGLNTSNWVWLLPLPLIANFLGSRFMAVVWTVVGVASLILFSTLSLMGIMEVSVDPELHPIAVSVSGPLLLILLCIAGNTFRTNQIIMEEKMNSHLHALGEEIKVRRKAEEAALEAEKAKAVFLRTISHEFRTPLNGVIGASTLLSPTRLDDEQKELLEVVTSSSEMLLDLINNVLDFSRLEANLFELEQDAVDIRAIIRSALLPLKQQSANKNVAIISSVGSGIPDYVIGDATKLSQIILNLCSNALKFTDQGEVGLTVDYEAGNLIIKVADTGIGIAENVASNLFEPFTQADTSTARVYGGSGLGLAIVEKLVRLFKGNIDVRSELGSGSLFTVVLPLAECGPPAEKASNTIDNRTVSKILPLTVLLVDDIKVNRMIARKMLERLNHSVVDAADGYEALEIMRRGGIDLVLMDAQMPKLDGFETTSRIRQLDAPICTTPIIALTAYTTDADKTALLDAGMNQCLSKPIRLADLQTALAPYSTNPSTIIKP